MLKQAVRQPSNVVAGTAEDVRVLPWTLRHVEHLSAELRNALVSRGMAVAHEGPQTNLGVFS